MANQFKMGSGSPGFEEDDMTLDDIEKDLEAEFSTVNGKGQIGPSSTRSNKLSPHSKGRSPKNMNKDDLKRSIAAKYNIKLKEKPRREYSKSSEARSPGAKSLGAKSAGAMSHSNGTKDEIDARPDDLESGVQGALREEKEDDDLERKNRELRRGFKYFLYNHHSCLGVLCVAHAYELPRYVRAYLFFFDLLCNFMFAVTLRTTGMAIVDRICLTVFLCLCISFVMSIVFKNCGLNKFLSGSGCLGKCCTMCTIMGIPTAICGSVTIVYLLRQDDGGRGAAIVFMISTVISLILEVFVWWIVYDCCKAYCSCFLCCCPNLLDDAEVAHADITHAKKKRELKKKLDSP
ncbi:hypothetical protein AAMO2058_000776100 [Amorphochlora amoebiformis]